MSTISGGNKMKASNCLTVLLSDQKKENDMSGDYGIPDYIPNVKRILAVWACPKIVKSTNTAEGISYDGEVRYTAVFLCEDGEAGESSVKSAVFGASFMGDTDAVAADTGTEESDNTVIIVPRVQAVNGRLLNPRKLNIKTKLEVQVRVFSKRCVLPVIEGISSPTNEAALEQKTHDSAAMEMKMLAAPKITMSEDIELESTYPPVKDIIFSDVAITVNEAKVSGDKVTLSGDAVFTALYESDAGNVVYISKKLPVLEEIDTGDMLSEDTRLLVRICGGELKTGIENNSYGESRIIELDYTYTPELLCVGNESGCVVEDMYSTEYESSGEYADVDSYYLLRSAQTNFSVNAQKSRSESGGDGAGNPIREIICTNVTLATKDVKYNPDHNRICYEGEAQIDVMARSDDDASAGKENIMVIHYTFPVKYELDRTNGMKNFDYDCVVNTSNIRTRYDSSNIYTDFEVILHMLLMGKKREHVLKTLKIAAGSPVNTQSRPPILLYYPQKGDTIWNVAKQYKTTSDAIAQANNITTETLANQKVILIPCAKAKPLYSAII